MPTDLLAEAFAELPAATTRCPVGRILDDASEKARTNLQAALDADHVSINWIIKQLHGTGQKVGKDSIGSHRSGACRCTR